MKLSRSRSLLFALLVAVLSTASACTVSADICMYVPTCNEYDQCLYDEVCWPEYEVEQIVEPNWCLYELSDEVYVKLNAQQVPYRWFVFHAGDTSAAPPSGYAEMPRFVQQTNGNCYLVFFW
jgi:hypothetical protein